MFALECGASSEVVRLLLDNKADASTADWVTHFCSQACVKYRIGHFPCCATIAFTRRPQESYITFTNFVVQMRNTVLMFAVTKDVRVETMQLLLDSGAATSINAKDHVTHLCFNLELFK
jgi:ankyrin repeat protein